MTEKITISPLMKFISKARSKSNLARNMLFWTWNIIFIIFVYVGLVPTIGAEILLGFQTGAINRDFAIFFMVLLVVPVASSILGFLHLRRDSKKLLELLYGIELPIFFLALIRIFFLRDLNLGVGYFILLFGLSTVYLANQLFRSTNSTSVVNLSGSSVYLWCGSWIFIALSFFVPPIALFVFQGIKGIFTSPSHLSIWSSSSLFSSIILVIGGVFVFYTAALLTLFPLVYIGSAFKNWKASFREVSKRNAAKAYWVSIGTGIIVTTLFFVTTKQDHKTVLEKLQASEFSEQEKIEISANQETYKKTLREIYLAPYRYLGEGAKSNFIKDIYARSFGVSEASVDWMQQIFNKVARPFIYHGTSQGMAKDHELAERLYRDIFDGVIQEEEGASIRTAIQATYSRENIEAGLININDRKVHLEKQELTLTEKGEWADLEIHEIYQNTTSRPEEVFLHLRLPPGAVITGLWLSDSEEKKFAAAISPRGAAQKVYKEIVRRGADPALLEQVGDQLYRLRVFPIPSNNGRIEKKEVMHMWVSLRVLRQSDSQWEMPLLTEKRNLFWDNKTEFSINGLHQKKAEEWIPSFIQASAVSSAQNARYLADGKIVEMEPFHPRLVPAACSISVVVDTSISMANRKTEIDSIYNTILEACGSAGVDFYIWNKELQKVDGDLPGQLASQIYWGTFGLTEFTNAFGKLGSEKRNVVVISDRTLFREEQVKPNELNIDKPVWFLMADQKYPRSAGDALLKRMFETGGGIETQMTKVLAAIERHEYLKSHTGVLDVDARYIWKITENTTASARTVRTDKQHPETSLGPVEPLVAHKLILAAVKHGRATELGELDRLQQLAQRSHIVSPFSSAIVLVDQAQKKMLEKATEESDRFDRQTENGQELLTTPKAPFEVTAVPEPEEWALIIAVLGFLLLHSYRKGFSLRRSYGTI